MSRNYSAKDKKQYCKNLIQGFATEPMRTFKGGKRDWKSVGLKFSVKRKF